MSALRRDECHGACALLSPPQCSPTECSSLCPARVPSAPLAGCRPLVLLTLGLVSPGRGALVPGQQCSWAGLEPWGLWGWQGVTALLAQEGAGQGMCPPQLPAQSGYQLEMEELGRAHGVLREEMGTKGVRLFSCFRTLQFGLFFHF